jgi:phospholipase C
MRQSALTFSLVAAAATAMAGSLKDIKHIILFMQENRSFDHVCRAVPWGCPRK